MTTLNRFNFDQATMKFEVFIMHRGVEVHSTVTLVEVEDQVYKVVFGDELQVLELQHRLILKKLLWVSTQGKNVELPASLE